VNPRTKALAWIDPASVRLLSRCRWSNLELGALAGIMAFIALGMSLFNRCLLSKTKFTNRHFDPACPYLLSPGSYPRTKALAWIDPASVHLSFRLRWSMRSLLRTIHLLPCRHWFILLVFNGWFRQMYLRGFTLCSTALDPWTIQALLHIFSTKITNWYVILCCRY